MSKTVKIIIFLAFISLALFLIFRNINNASNDMRELPTEEELNEFISVISNSDINTYEVKDISNEQIATIYYNDFKNEVINNSEEIYQKIRNKNTITEDVFNSFRNDLINNYYNNKIVDYSISDSTYTIINSNNQRITFYIETGFNYELELTL